MADRNSTVGIAASPDVAAGSAAPDRSLLESGFTRWLRQSADVIKHAEQSVYAVIGAMLVLALILALLGSLTLLLQGARDLTHTDAIFQIIDRLLFVLMLVEILHTVHASIRSGTLVCAPFLIVGLIACIRRILVITLETSQITQPERWGAGNMPLFQASMIELGVLALLIVVLVGSIRFTRDLDD